MAHEFLDNFAEHRLTTPESIKCALQKLDDKIEEQHYKALLEGLLSSAYASRPLIELVLSGAPCNEPFARWIIRQFLETQDSLTTSLSFALLARLSLFLLFLPFAYEPEVSEQLSFYRVWVELAPKVLESLSSSSFSQEEEPDVAACSDAENEDWGRLKRKKSSQRERKRAKRTAVKAVTTFNVKACEALGLDAPSSSREADTLSAKILGTLKTIFEFYFETLRLSNVADTIKRGLLPSVPILEHEDAVDLEPRVPDANEADTHKTPATYPIVQPMKAALYFDSATGFGEWRILISTRADRNLREARRKDAKFFKIVVKKIKELSNGHFSDDNQKRLNGLHTEIPIYEAKMTRDSRLVYQVDCIPEYDSEVERQGLHNFGFYKPEHNLYSVSEIVLKIFGIYTHAQIDQRLWDSMGHQLGRKGKEYRHRCTFRNRPHHAGDNVIMPACFPPQEKIEPVTSNPPELPKEDLEEIHSLLVLEKFVTFSQALLNSMLADLDVTHVFSVTPQEKEIIEHPYSCYVLGRSGTGKTTTMLFKMLGIERAFELKRDSMTKPRQLFVTQSRVLATKVEEYFSKLLESLSTASRTPQELLEISKKKKSLQEDEGLVDLDDEMNWRPDLPSKFSLLRDEHFPLFLTFDRLARLLEADISERGLDPPTFGKGFMSMDRLEDTTTVPTGGNLITYSVFLQSYWPHFSQSLTKGLDSSLVFGELMGVLQGSEETLNQDSHFLDKYTYESLSHRAQYAFANHREIVYAIFLLYLKRKRLRGDYDSADRTHWILKAFRSSDPPGQKLDYLYVDEAQDNLLIDALLLRSLCRNPNGLFWAGDTAQTISVGSSFRFNDLKAFLFRLEKRRKVSKIDNESSLQEPPKTFQLAVNYRSHGGIVHCAHSVIELITGFWPYAIDILAQERGVVNGSRPVFFSGWDKETVRYEQFLFGTTGSRIEFGAQQCILVRNEAARNELREQVGDIGLIMTLYESKGLEFDDVLLYKFFENSTVDLSQWRVVLNAIGDNTRLPLPAPRFNESRHAAICIELKFLYVAITRARKNLWIVDCSEKSEPMKIFWTSRNQIQNCTPGTDVPRLAVSSSPEEWERSGRSLFQNKRYLQAMHCFERAGLNREVSVTHTYYLREQARVMPAGGSKQSIQSREKAFVSAAEAFGQCAVVAHNPKEKRAYFRNSADCFEQAGDDRNAAQAYVNAAEFTDAAKLYRKCGLFDEAVDIVTSHGQDVHTEVAKGIIDVARLYYYSKNKLEKAGRLFSSEDEELEYLEDYDLDVARAGVLDRMGRYTDAAEIHLAEGRTMDAITILLKAKTDKDAIRRAKDCILQGLWTTMSFASSLKVSERNAESTRLLRHASELEDSILDSTHPKDELTMFRAIKSNDKAQLRILGQHFVANKNHTSALLCFEHYFTKFPSVIAMGVHDIAGILEDFLMYCRLVQDICCATDPCNDPDIQKLFGFQPSTENVFLIPEGTYFHQMLGSRPTPDITITSELAILTSGWNLSRALKRCLFDHLCARVQEGNDICWQRVKAYAPCLPYAVFNVCNRRECPRQHLEPTASNPSTYNDLVRIHLQQTLVFNNLRAMPSFSSERQREQKRWINRLYETIYPASYHLGTLANLDFARIPEAQKAIGVVKYWARELLYMKYQRPEPRILTTVYRAVNLVVLFDRANAGNYLQGAPLINQFAHRQEFRRGLELQAPCVVHDLVRSLQGADEAFISAGVLFFRQVVAKYLHIDIGMLCDLLDYICGSIVLVRANFAVHNLTLPRSWFIHLLRHIKKKKAETILIGVFTASIGILLEQLHSGMNIEYLLFENTDLTKVPLIRNIFISRICRTLCLLGYNINHIELRNDIMRQLRQLRMRPHNLYRSYAEARSWDIIARTVTKSISGSSMDEMVQLYHESRKPGPIYQRPGVRRVFFKSVEQVPGLLSGIMVPSFMSDLRVDAPVFVPRMQPKTEILEPEKPLGSGETNVDAGEDVEEREVDSTVVLSTTVGAESIVNTVVVETDVPPSDEQIRATCVFQAAYRRALLRRRKPSRIPTAIQISRIAFSDSCLKQSSSMHWPNNYYRLLFLGPLPHVLACIAAIDTYIMGAKAKTKKRLKETKHQALEDVGARITEINGIVKEVKRLQKELQPQSPLHVKRDLEELKARVLEVEMLAGRVPPAIAHEIQEDLQRGLRGIVAVKQLPKAKPKPVLHIDDDQDLDFDEPDIDEEQVEVEVEVVQKEEEKLSRNEEEVDEKEANMTISIIEKQPSSEELQQSREEAMQEKEFSGKEPSYSEVQASDDEDSNREESSEESKVEQSLEILWTGGR